MKWQRTSPPWLNHYHGCWGVYLQCHSDHSGTQQTVLQHPSLNMAAASVWPMALTFHSTNAIVEFFLGHQEHNLMSCRPLLWFKEVRGYAGFLQDADADPI
ncbi:hypothetical protein GN956_G4011 [Arapaima gigas]